MGEEERKKYTDMFQQQKTEWERKFGPIKEYRSHRRMFLKRKRELKEQRQLVKDGREKKKKTNERKSLPQMVWKAPVTSRQRRWLNRPSTEALDDHVFGRYRLSDVEQMCRAIW